MPPKKSASSSASTAASKKTKRKQDEVQTSRQRRKVVEVEDVYYDEDAADADGSDEEVGILSGSWAPAHTSSSSDDDFEDDIFEDDDFEDDDVDEAGGNGASGESSPNATIDVEFEAQQTCPRDVWVIANLINGGAGSLGALLGGPEESRQLAEALCSQQDIGTVVRVADQEPSSSQNSSSGEGNGSQDGMKDSDAAYAVISCLPYYLHKDSPFLSNLSSYILKSAAKHGDAPTSQRFEMVLKGSASKTPRVGLVISERVVNMPPQLAPQMHQVLYSEVAELALRDDDFIFDHYLFVTRVFRSKKKPAPNSSKSKSKAKTKGKAKKNGQEEEDDENLYLKIEDELYHEAAVAHFLVPVEHMTSDKKPGMEEEFNEYRLFMLVHKNRIDEVLTKIQEHIV